MIRLFFAIFGGAFIVMMAGLAVAPSLVLGAYQDDFVKAWTEAGVDTSSCEGSVPKLGIGVQKCFEGSMRDLAENLSEADENSGDRWNED